MIGFFVFDDTPSIESPIVLAHSALNIGIQGLFYVRSMDCKDIASVEKGSEFFGVLDDASGFGACLFVKGLAGEKDALLLEHSLHVKGDAKVDGSLAVDGQLSGKSTTTKLTISADDLALLAAQITTMPGPLGSVTLNHVNVEMKNG